MVVHGYTYVYNYAHNSTRVCMYGHEYVSVNGCTQVYIHECISVYMSVHVRTWVLLYVNECSHIVGVPRVLECTLVYLHIYTCLYQVYTHVATWAYVGGHGCIHECTL